MYFDIGRVFRGFLGICTLSIAIMFFEFGPGVLMNENISEAPVENVVVAVCKDVKTELREEDVYSHLNERWETENRKYYIATYEYVFNGREETLVEESKTEISIGDTIELNINVTQGDGISTPTTTTISSVSYGEGMTPELATVISAVLGIISLILLISVFPLRKIFEP